MAWDRFSRVYWPCGFSKNGERCTNTMAGHAKGHQNECGTIIGSGGYESTLLFTSFNRGWCEILEKEISQLSKEVAATQSSLGITEERAAAKNHLKVIGGFYNGPLSAEKFQSHTMCLCCLSEYPEHPLRCGHILCMGCVQSFGHPENGAFKITNCPLHCQDTNWEEQPWPIAIMPPSAGVRILSLDG
jgi:hypothetical protein